MGGCFSSTNRGTFYGIPLKSKGRRKNSDDSYDVGYGHNSDSSDQHIGGDVNLLGCKDNDSSSREGYSGRGAWSGRDSCDEDGGGYNRGGGSGGYWGGGGDDREGGYGDD